MCVGTVNNFCSLPFKRLAADSDSDYFKSLDYDFAYLKYSAEIDKPEGLRRFVRSSDERFQRRRRRRNYFPVKIVTKVKLKDGAARCRRHLCHYFRNLFSRHFRLIWNTPVSLSKKGNTNSFV